MTNIEELEDSELADILITPDGRGPKVKQDALNELIDRAIQTTQSIMERQGLQ